MSDRREQILNGELFFPNQIMDIVNPEKDQDITLVIEEFWANIWHNFLREKNSDTITWMIKFDNKNLFNNLLMHLSKSGWITSEFDGEYAWITLNESKLFKWITKEELIGIKFKYKFVKYRLQNTKSIIYDVVQNNRKHSKTGLIRKGFMKAGNNVFKYDTKYLSKYVNEIAMNVKKGLRNSTKDITYQEIIDELLNYYSNSEMNYTLGNCYIDSRGRAIFNCSKKVFNPVSCKDARALLVCEAETLTSNGWDVVYAAISELLGYRGKDYEDKVWYGKCMYITRELPSIEDMRTSSNYDDLHVRIWLERIYENIDSYDETGWYVPIEIDAMASMIQLIGVLTNDYEYMKKTNLIVTEDGFQDVWSVDYVSRNHVKKAMTPQLYGSGKHTKDLWDANDLQYDRQQLNRMVMDMTIGIYANANKFKDHIINNVNPQNFMTVNINGEVFTIECNRFKWEETTSVDYFVYTNKGILSKVTRSFSLTPDPNQFKRYFVTLLLHNLDSQIANRICNDIDWILPNHDSFTIHPNDAISVRKSYTTCMYHVYTSRKKILKDYFKSVGINEEYKEKECKELITGFSPYCLK